jgi:hypothetical protein
MTVDLVALKAANANRWAKAKLTRNFTRVAKRLVAAEAKARYQAVEAHMQKGPDIYPGLKAATASFHRSNGDLCRRRRASAGSC